ncbi:MAG: phosphate/phosphite/phosphonate ABC transporter substrate-binding protein [Rhodoferax sp.]
MTARVGYPVVFVARETYRSVLDLLFSDQLDAAWICGYPYTLYRSRLNLISTPLYRGRPVYQAYLINNGRPESPIRGWVDLKGRVLAYADPLSNSGWLVAQSQLRSAGLGARDLRRGFFARGHRNVAEAVASGLAHAGCIDGYVWETMRRQGMAAAHQTGVIWRSPWYGFPPLVSRLGASDGLIARLTEALLGMHRDDQGQALLDALNLSGFAAPNPALYESIAAMARAVQPASV